MLDSSTANERASVAREKEPIDTREALALHVECYAGYRGEETPQRFQWAARRVEIVEVLDRWLDPRHRYFKVRGDDGAVYILRHDAASDRWELTLYDSGRTPGGKLSST